MLGQSLFGAPHAGAWIETQSGEEPDLYRLQASGMKVPSTSIEKVLEMHVEALSA